jgi:hypothetical protein
MWVAVRSGADPTLGPIWRVGDVALCTVVGAAEVLGVECTVRVGSDGSVTGMVGAVVGFDGTRGVHCTVVLGIAGVVVTLTGGAGCAETLGSVGHTRGGVHGDGLAYLLNPAVRPLTSWRRPRA